MDSRSWDRLEMLLEQATALPPAQRDAFIERETDGEPALRTQLVGLLEAASDADERISKLQEELLGSSVQDMLREAAVAGDGADPWIGRTVSHYEIVERLGSGGMGVIYRAHDLRLKRTIALKFIAPEIHREPAARARFLHEARAASTLDHPNICTIHEIGETDDGRPFIVMPAYDGETLRSRLTRSPIPAPEALAMAGQIAEALAAAHERGIVHRDVKPDNVFITNGGVVKLLDFGLARPADHRMSRPGTLEGTVAYMSPEQARGDHAVAASDVWSLGVILFEMLAGARPFSANDVAAVLDLIQTRDPDLTARRSDLTPGIVHVVQRALMKDPDARFHSGREFLEAMRRIQAEASHIEVPATARTKVTAGAFRAGLSAIALIGIAGMTARWIRSNVDAVPRPGAFPPGAVSHVLWVDDNPENNAAVIQQLQRLGVQVTTALNTAAAVQQYDPAVHHVVMSDMGRFEGLNNAYVERAGLDLLLQLRAKRPDVRLIFCTSARAAATYRAEAFAAGAAAVVEDCAAAMRLMGH